MKLYCQKNCKTNKTSFFADKGAFQSSGGFSLIDILVGVALLLIVFLGIFGAYQLGIKVIGQSRNKIIATAIANKEIELIKNLPYSSIGVEGSFPDGVLTDSTTTISNNVMFTVENRVDFIIDSADGISAPEDECPNDYKKVEVKVSWQGRFPGEVKLVSDISPKNLAQECQDLGGILSISVFDAFGLMVTSPLIEIRDPVSEEIIKTATPFDGEHYFSLEASTYKVVVSKSGYSADRTYGVEEVITPDKPHPMVLDGQFIENSFSIDKVSSFSVDTLSPWGQDFFSDPFDDESQISESSNIQVINGEVQLSTSTEGYLSSGYLLSTDISPVSMLFWDEFSFTDLEPFETDLKYQFYYATDTSWLIVENADLNGNSEGFDVSPVDLSGLDTGKYESLKIRANFSTNTTTTSPSLQDYQVSWITSEAMPTPSVTFNLQGAKIIGTDADELPVYKYSQDHTSNAQGHIDLYNLEWDSYAFSVLPASGLDLVDISPSPQPIELVPDDAGAVELYLDAENSLLVTLQNEETLETIFAGTVRLFNAGLGYDKSQYTDSQGQTYFIPLTQATYDLEVIAAGYLPKSTSVLISGDETETIKLTQVE